ncbi:HAD-IIB family hydrolase [Sinisalibacter aestuarii]|uniref:Mannosyl-3-phosphoglycerate phosphatase n=1 Tax=Sinisalibacter aestuarii TaxID=2949426 RepID=A0ABQ5LRG4_9RHOB|nr:HAD-IIB family hydrolase [Sinisalibacter aestuarii]GKY87313.1 mannosyl-3-phosphoglycerate phosphatase [Sinisalibacter aestuarii]
MTQHAPGTPRLVVFTDLDGTLLDHGTYAHDAAGPALAALAARGAPLVLASSKTAAEIAPLHRALRLGRIPAIVENGAAVYRPGEPGRGAAGYARLRRVLDDLPVDLRRGFKGFGEMSAAEVARETGLAPADAARAKRRAHSEPGLWTGSAGGRAAFIAALAAQGVTVRQGGRFLTLSFGGTKADRMTGIAAELGADLTLALGDAPNDVEMLEAADFGVIIRNDHGPGIGPLPGEATGRITRSARPGPEGWNDAVLGFLATHPAREAQRTHG